MAILITGGTGYIGSHTCIELIAAGYDVIIVDNLSNSKLVVLDRLQEITGKTISFYPIDLCVRSLVEQVFAENTIEAVIHFAGLKAVGESVAQPLTYYHTNLLSTIILCETMQKYGVMNFVFSSSATVYGAQEQMPLTEDMTVGAMSPYGQTKVMNEQILRDVCHSDPRFSIALLRYFNPVGAHRSGRIGEDPNGIPNNLVPYITQVAVGKLAELKVCGNDYPTPDGTGVRDYIHVLDLARGHVKALEKIMGSAGVVTYNLGTGKGYSVLEVLASFERACGSPIAHRVVERRPGDSAVSYASTAKAERELGWRAQYSMDEMCVDSWRWQQNNPNGYEA